MEEGRIAMNRRDGGIPCVSEKDGRSRASARASCGATRKKGGEEEKSERKNTEN